jgi:membrane protein YdbS with pleckstrin-like domain
MQLHPRAVAYFMTRNALPWLVASFWLAVIVVSNNHSPPVLPGVQYGVVIRLALAMLAAFLILALINWLFCSLKARSYRVELQNDGIALDYGVLTQSHEVLLYKNIQDILINRSLLERIMGLSTIVIQNAMGKPERIPGLDVRAAEMLRDDIVRHAVR